MKDDKEKNERMIHIRLDDKTHRALRIKAAKKDMSIQQLVASLIEREVKSEMEEKEGR